MKRRLEMRGNTLAAFRILWDYDTLQFHHAISVENLALKLCNIVVDPEAAIIAVLTGEFRTDARR